MKIFIISLIVIMLGAFAIFYEKKYYQYVDDNGLLHESLFMPIGTILILLGVSGIVFAIAKRYGQTSDKRN